MPLHPHGTRVHRVLVECLKHREVSVQSSLKYLYNDESTIKISFPKIDVLQKAIAAMLPEAFSGIFCLNRKAA